MNNSLLEALEDLDRLNESADFISDEEYYSFPEEVRKLVDNGVPVYRELPKFVADALRLDEDIGATRFSDKKITKDTRNGPVTVTSWEDHYRKHVKRTDIANDNSDDPHKLFFTKDYFPTKEAYLAGAADLISLDGAKLAADKFLAGIKHRPKHKIDSDTKNEVNAVKKLSDDANAADWDSEIIVWKAIPNRDPYIKEDSLAGQAWEFVTYEYEPEIHYGKRTTYPTVRTYFLKSANDIMQNEVNGLFRSLDTDFNRRYNNAISSLEKNVAAEVNRDMAKMKKTMSDDDWNNAVDFRVQLRKNGIAKDIALKVNRHPTAIVLSLVEDGIVKVHFDCMNSEMQAQKMMSDYADARKPVFLAVLATGGHNLKLVGDWVPTRSFGDTSSQDFNGWELKRLAEKGQHSRSEWIAKICSRIIDKLYKNGDAFQDSWLSDKQFVEFVNNGLDAYELNNSIMKKNGKVFLAYKGTGRFSFDFDGVNISNGVDMRAPVAKEIPIDAK